MSRTLNVAAVQMVGNPAPRRERLARAERLIAGAAAAGAQLVVLPEVFNTGYEYSDVNYARAEPLTGRTVTWMRRTAAREDVYLAGTLLLRDVEDIYNALLLVAPEGRIWRYDKHHPWAWERAYFRPGDCLTVAETPLGRFGLLVCWDQAHPQLWARYAGKVDAIIVCSSPPAAHDMTFVLPDGLRLTAGEAGPIPRHMKRTSADAFGACLRRQSAALEVPMVHTTATGTFGSEVPYPRLSLFLYAPTRVDLWRRFLQTDTARVEMAYYDETWVADADGGIISRVPPGAEDYALAEIALPAPSLRPQQPQPTFGISSFAYLFDEAANLLLTPRYRRRVRRHVGPRMAPPARHRRRWLIALAIAVGLGFLLGRFSKHIRRQR